jgi:hypothetical protein
MIDAETMERVRMQLSSRAELFEDPRTYLDGVEDALGSLHALELDETDASAHPTVLDVQLTGSD